jgi:hypothetical protein
MDIKVKQTLSVILAIASSIGVIATAFIAVKETEKAKKSKDNLLLKNPKATKKEIVIAEGLAYAPAICVGVATISSVIASHMLSKKAEASLIAGASLIGEGWNKYQYKVKDLLGIDVDKKIRESIANDDSKKLNLDKTDERTLYYVEPIGFFKAKAEDLAWAYGDMNQRLHTVDKDSHHTAFFCLIYDMILDSNAEIMDPNIANDVNKLNWGWSSEYLDEKMKPEWIQMTLTEKKTEDGTPYTLISFDVSPIRDPSYGGGMYLDNSDEVDSLEYKKVKKIKEDK